MKLVKLAIIFIGLYAFTANGAEIRESFPTTEDGSGVGVPLTNVSEGDASSGVDASAALVAEDESGNLIYLNLDASGRLKVDTEYPIGTKKYARGKITGSGTLATVAEITLTADDVYSGIEWTVGSFRAGLCEIQWIDDEGGTPTTTILADVYFGSGDYSDSGRLENLEFTAGSTGIQKLRIQCLSQTVASDIRATITTYELD